MKRTSLHLDNQDLKALDRLAQVETQRTGSRISASQIVRRLIRQFLHYQPSFGFLRDQAYDKQPLEAMIVRDEDGTIRYWSREAQLIYGWTAQEVLGARTHNLFKTRFPREARAWTASLPQLS